jgi:hypothetical protein
MQPQLTPRRALLILLTLNVLVWQLAAWTMRWWGLPYFAFDDFPRSLLAESWGHSPFPWPADAQWLPLPFYLHGGWQWLFDSPPGTVGWTIPASALMIGIGATGVGWAGLALVRAAGLPAFRWPLLLVAVWAPLMIRDNWRVAASALSEPAFLMLLGWATAAAAATVEARPGRSAHWAALVALLVAFQMTRYEAIVLAAVLLAATWAFSRTEARPWRRSLPLLAAGLGVLALFPLGWLALNARVHGDALNFLAITRQHARSFTLYSSLSTPDRLLLVLGWMKGQGPLVAALGLAGLAAGRRLRPTGPVAAVFLCALALNLWMAFSNSIGNASPSRFNLGIFWTLIPPALLAAARAASLSRSARATLLLILGLGSALLLGRWMSHDWGGLPVSKDQQAVIESLENAAKREDCMIIIDHAEKLPLTNMLRVYCGWNRIGFLYDLSPDRPMHGRFLYLHQREGWLADRKVGRALNHDIAFLRDLPPPGAFAGNGPTTATRNQRTDQ